MKVFNQSGVKFFVHDTKLQLPDLVRTKFVINMKPGWKSSEESAIFFANLAYIPHIIQNQLFHLLHQKLVLNKVIKSEVPGKTLASLFLSFNFHF